jgi:hypothetical protein
MNAASHSTPAEAAAAAADNNNDSGGRPSRFRRADSNSSQNQKNKEANDNTHKLKKNRAEARRLKLDSQLQDVDIGHQVTIPLPVEDDQEDALRHASMDTHTNNNGGDGGGDHAEDAPTVSSDDGSSNDRTMATGVLYSKSSPPMTTTAGGGGSGGGAGNNNNSISSSNNNSGGVLFGKSSSLIFPTGVEPPHSMGDNTTASLSGRSVGTTVSNTTGGNSIGGGANNNNNDASNTSNNHKRHKINLLLDQCETVRFPFKKKLMLNSLNLTAADIPVKDLYGTSLGNSLHKLSMAGNRLSTIPPRLVTCLPVLKTLDLSQCELHQLPERWNLPQLKRLNLSHNRLTDFPEEVSFSVDETTNETTFWFSSFSLSIRSFSIVFPDHVGRSLGIARTQHVRK